MRPANIYFDATRIHRYDFAPMSVVPPKFIAVRRFTDFAHSIQGELDYRLCERLLKLVSDCRGGISVDLEFNRDGQGRVLVTGAVAASVVTICQRCLEPVTVRLDSKVSLCMVATVAQANQLPDFFEPLVVDDEQVNIIDLVEDELLLELPSVAMHDSCEPPVMQGNIDGLASIRQENPFAVLRKLRV